MISENDEQSIREESHHDDQQVDRPQWHGQRHRDHVGERAARRRVEIDAQLVGTP